MNNVISEQKQRSVTIDNQIKYIVTLVSDYTKKFDDDMEFLQKENCDLKNANFVLRTKIGNLIDERQELKDEVVNLNKQKYPSDYNEKMTALIDANKRLIERLNAINQLSV